MQIIFVRYNKYLNSASFNRYLGIIKASSFLFDVSTISNRTNVINNDEMKIFKNLRIKSTFFISSKKKQTNKLSKTIDLIRSNIKSLRKIKSQRGENKIVFLYSVNIFDFIFFYFGKILYKYKLVTERNEYPDYIIQNQPIKKFFFEFFIFKLSYKIFDGIVLMTDSLIKYYSQFLKKNCIVTKIPMTIDIDRFKNIKKINKDKYILYVGSFNQKKDGVIDLIKSYNKIGSEIKDFNLLLIGGSEEEINRIKFYVDNKLKNKVEFKGYVERSKIPNYIINSCVLVLPRPSSKQAEGGFPTKLGEYLASGNPVIASKIGELPKYLKHNKNIVFFEPGNIQNLADELKKVCLQLDDFIRLGINGQQVAIEKFSLDAQVNKLKRFYYQLSN